VSNYKKGGDDPQRLEEALARHPFAHGRAPSWKYPNFCVRGLFSLTHNWVNDCKRRTIVAARPRAARLFLGSIKAPVPSFFNRLSLCKRGVDGDPANPLHS
jgi:hypothetical protein